MDFSELNALGWIGVAIRLLVFITVVWKPSLYFNYEKRFPKIRTVDYYIYNEYSEYAFMGLRFIVFFILMWVVTGWMI